MEEDYIFITGMVRSGTTLISRAIDAHSQAATPPDPYFAFFREFRNEIYKMYQEDFADDSALDDNFFNANLAAKKEIRNNNLDRKINKQSLVKIKEKLCNFAEPNSPLVIPYINEIEADTYKELFIQLMDIVKKSYGSEDTNYIGFKQTWVEEFITPLINTFANMKIVQIIRDPRAVIASRTKTTHLSHNYPLLFMIKHWRKSFAYALYNNYHYEDNFKLIRYEDLTTQPEHTISEICNFIGLDYEEEMINPNYYRDGKDNSWTDNSAYDTASKITAKFKDKWKEILSSKELQYVEDLCQIEMNKLGYERETELRLRESIFSQVQFKDELDTSWIKKEETKESANLENIKNELLRHYIYQDQNNEKLDGDLLEMAFIIPEFLKLINKVTF